MGAGDPTRFLWVSDAHKPVVVELPAADVVERLHRTDGEGFNWLDIARPGSAWPMLSVLVHDQWAVAHLLAAEGSPTLLFEGASPAAPAEFDFKYVEGAAPFTSEFIIDLAMAKDLIFRFASNERWPDGFRWVEL